MYPNKKNVVHKLFNTDSNIKWFIFLKYYEYLFMMVYVYKIHKETKKYINYNTTITKRKPCQYV